MDWRHHAACRDMDPEIWFPVGTSGPALALIAEAKTVCQRCPVNSACLGWALASGQDDGVWGGMSEGERRAMRTARARAQTSLDDARQCVKCKERKRVTEFGRDQHAPDGIAARCRECRNAGEEDRRRRRGVQPREQRVPQGVSA